MDDLIKTLNNYFKYTKFQDVLLSIIELILSTLVGGLLGVWLSTPKVNTWIIIGFFVAIIILIALIINRLIKQVHFPYEAISFLENREQLTKATNDLNRKEIIYEYIDDAIKMLNVNTCSITSVSNQENFCQTPLAEGLQTLLSPLILQTHYILNCNKSHFTIAAYIEGCPVENINIDNSTNPPTQKKFINYESKTFCFKDDFNLSEYFVDDILEANTLTGISLAIHTKGQIAFNDLTFDFSKLKVDNKEYNFISCYIPAVCEGSSIGVFFIVTDGCVSLPEDLKNVLLIFGRITANWIEKYIACMEQRVRSSH